MDGTIFKFRVERTQVKSFPFDLFYLVPISQKQILPHLFPWSLCFAPNAAFIQAIAYVRVQQVEQRLHTTRVINLTQKSYRVADNLPHNWTTAYFVVVPVLPMEKVQVPKRKKDNMQLRATKKGVKGPGYLTAPQHADVSKSKLEGVLDDDTVLFTPSGAVRPVCNACPRHLLHIQNKCELGGKYCFSELVLKRNVYEQLQENGAHADSDPNHDQA